MIFIVGLGPGDIGHITLKTLHILKNTKKVFFHTAKHPCVSDLSNMGIQYKSFDSLYNTLNSFEEFHQTIAKKLLKRLKTKKKI